LNSVEAEVQMLGQRAGGSETRPYNGKIKGKEPAGRLPTRRRAGATKTRRYEDPTL